MVGRCPKSVFGASATRLGGSSADSDATCTVSHRQSVPPSYRWVALHLPMDVFFIMLRSSAGFLLAGRIRDGASAEHVPIGCVVQYALAATHHQRALDGLTSTAHVTKIAGAFFSERCQLWEGLREDMLLGLAMQNSRDVVDIMDHVCQDAARLRIGSMAIKHG
jgi:hypothetical protein